MSGQDVVRAMRSGEPLQKSPRPGREPQPVARGPRSSGRRPWGLFDIGLVVVSVFALGILGYFGLARYVLQRPAVQTVAIAQADDFGSGAWTEADQKACERRAQAAADAPVPAELAFSNPAVTKGFAGLATLLECRITTKAGRFCDPKEKAALVEMVRDYLGRADLIVAALDLQGAPMSLMGDMMGGEAKAGSAIYNLQKDSTIAFMKLYHGGVSSALKTLARNGVISVSDFGAFMGMGVPKNITEMFKGITPTANPCA